MHKTIVAGRVGQNPQPIGQNGAKFSVAVDEWDGQAKERKAVWYNFVAFGKVVETIRQYVHQGTYVVVEARYAPREYQGQNGKAIDHSFMVDRLELGPRTQGQGQAPQQQAPQQGWGQPAQQQPDQGWGAPPQQEQSSGW